WDTPHVLLHESVDEKIKRFEHWAVRLAVEAAEKILKKCRTRPTEIDALFVSTCTGYLCPGVSSYVSQQIGLPDNIYTLDLVGLGCAGALPALRAADDYLHRYPDSNVLVIAVEICSAAIHWAQKPELILSNAIFSDGAAAVLLTNRAKIFGFKINSISSVLWPQFRDELRFKYLDSRLCNVISPKTTEIVSQALGALDGLPKGSGKHGYAFHSGGRKILDAIQERLHLSDEEMLPSRQILRDYGNMSSPSVLFVLKEILNQGLRDKHPVTCFSFGAGFLASILRGEWQA
ncbi:MAG: 3-oxoacyl-[acyl-carrier-protein] synthase III C-terminal domain-containing protein, partial [Candidatus Omnitrophota bacterium]|nr:3-oxoacyl-[acyl-carrier-protein] synthase III C-terminal domain-containing protein [Candidatus Omnitrophota bacterium]